MKSLSTSTLRACPAKLQQSKACPAKLQRSRGFSFIEIMIVLAIIGVLATFGIIVGLDSYGRYNFHAEADNAVALLQKARSESINNIGGVAHGVHFSDAGDLILFSGIVYNPPAYEIKIAKNNGSVYGGAGDIVFSQLSGATTDSTVTITSVNGSTATININHEGGIDY